jgi:hypothetical protein
VQIGTLTDGTAGGVNISWTQGASVPTDTGSAAANFLGGKVSYLAQYDLLSAPLAVRQLYLTTKDSCQSAAAAECEV